MENLGDILKRLRENQSANGDGTDWDDGASPPNEPEEEVCPICEGRLWLAIDAPVGHPDFGKAEPCQCQTEIDLSELATRLRRYSNLGSLSNRTFGSTDPNGRSDDPISSQMFARAYETALAYAEHPKGWIVLVGPNGSGKTHLAAAIANHCIEQGNPVFFVHVPDLLDDLRSTYSPISEFSYSELFEQVNEAPLLILDGLGAQSPTPWAQEKLQQIFNRRASAELPTVVTTAVDLAEIDPYIASRMTLGRILEVRGQSQGPTIRLGRVPHEMVNRMTFDKFEARGNAASHEQRSSLNLAFNRSKAWASDPDGWLTLFGRTGTGKTHLAVAIAEMQLAQGRPAFFAFVPELMDYLRYTFQPNSGVAYDRVFDDVRNTPLLILDDLGSEYRTGWAEEKLYQIIVHRHNLRMPTVITTSLEVTETPGPIFSRIQDPSTGRLIPMDAPDYRTGNRQGTPEHRPRGRNRR